MFKKAIPVFADGKEWEKNTHVTLRGTLPAGKNATLRIAAASIYRVFMGGKFVAFGPARTAKGYARVDEIQLGALGGELKIEVAGYACRSFILPYERSFVCAEAEAGGEILLATGESFPMYLSTKFLQKTERYSVQRTFGEVCDERLADIPAHAVPVEAPALLPRRVPAPLYREVQAPSAAVCGTFVHDEALSDRQNSYSFRPDEHWGKFETEDIPYKPYRWVHKQAQTPRAKNVPLPLTLSAGEYALFDFSRIEVGFIKFRALSAGESDVVVAFSEFCEGEKFAFTVMNCQNVLEYILPEGEREVMSFEPYSARFAIVFVKTGKITLKSLGFTTYERDMSEARRVRFGDAALQGIYDAAVATFAHNAVDIFTDCPSRERAGWLCDSYFMGKAERFFFGTNDVESAFLENYRLYERDEDLPRGVLPMCYPACTEKRAPDYEGKFIPQWDMWYVLEVREFLTERSTGTDKELFRESVMGVLEFLAQYENELGLLERFPSWNFVEWSTANKWTHDVNFPTNFLYAAVLDAAYALYGGEALPQKAANVRKNATALSFDGEVFCDNAVRENGALVRTRNCSEACQYYAALFGGIDIDAPEYAKLKSHMLDGFKTFASALGARVFVPVNAFIGLYLRIMMLVEMGEKELLLKDVKAFFGGMAKDTGTLWENKDKNGSLDHGFASYAAIAMAWACDL